MDKKKALVKELVMKHLLPISLSSTTSNFEQDGRTSSGIPGDNINTQAGRSRYLQPSVCWGARSVFAAFCPEQLRHCLYYCFFVPGFCLRLRR